MPEKMYLVEKEEMLALTGDVDTEKGTLQEQIENLSASDVGAIPHKVNYYSANTGADIDTIMDSLMLVGKSLVPDCPINDDFVYILQLFYGGTGDTPRIQIAFPYKNISGGVYAVRMFYTGAWTDWNGALPLTGGTLSGTALKLSGGSGQLWSMSGDATTVSIVNLDDSSRYRTLYISDPVRRPLINAVQLRNEDGKYYSLFGQHNKPSGSYTGTGDATEFTIDTGGVGNICYLTCGTYKALVTGNGALCFRTITDGVIYTLPADKVRFVSGVLTIACTDACVNYSGYVHSWNVI